MNMSSFLKSFFRTYYKWAGWTVDGEIPEDIPKAVLVGGGHTSNWDLVYAVGALFTLDKPFNYMIKKEALVFPLKNMLLELGAIPIDRSQSSTHNYVDQIADFFQKKSQIYLCISPEGTRSAVQKWKTGYFHIAKKAQVPIIPCYFNYKEKFAKVGTPIFPGESVEETTRQLKDVFKNAVPRHPELYLKN